MRPLMLIDGWYFRVKFESGVPGKLSLGFLVAAIIVT